MSKDKSFGLEHWQIAVMIGCIAGLLASIYGVYTVNPTDDPAKVAAPPKLASSPTPTLPLGAKITKQYATGKLAAFAIHKERKVVANVEFSDETGKARSISDWRGKVVLVNLWATWCAPCRREMPELAELQTKLGGKDFEVVAISVDRKSPHASAAFLIENKSAALTLYVDQSAKALERFAVAGLPGTILIDREGKEIGRLLGPAEWASEDAFNLIKAAIAEGQ